METGWAVVYRDQNGCKMACRLYSKVLMKKWMTFLLVLLLLLRNFRSSDLGQSVCNFSTLTYALRHELHLFKKDWCRELKHTA